MPTKIHALDSSVIDQIAAGEVVERPASVVKELVDNAIDAGATQVWVDLEDGGVGLIRVVDNGEGIAREDIPLALARHATSKLRAFDDLQSLTTFGFRGEALASIASVSKLSLVTRRREDEVGTRAEFDEGGGLRMSDSAHAIGTLIEARELFHNVPARLKFLKSAATESAHVQDVVVRAALSDPKLRVRLRRDGRVVRELLAATTRKARAETIFDESLVTVEAERDGIGVEAYLGAPEHARTGTQNLHLFINGRPVRDRALARAAAFAYGTALAQGQFPIGVMYVTMPPREVDINAHPQKSEVRFAHPHRVTAAVTHVLHTALASARWPKSQAPSVSEPEDYATTAGLLREALFVSEPPPTLSYRVEPEAVRQEAAVDLHVLGVSRNEHAVLENEEGLLIVDLVALDALVLRTELERKMAEGAIPMQPLLFPARVPLMREAMASLEVEAESLKRAGFDVAVLGQDLVMIHGAPQPIDGAHAGVLFLAYFDALRALPRDRADRHVQALYALASEATSLMSPKKRYGRLSTLLGMLKSLDAESLKRSRVVRSLGWAELDGVRPGRS